MDIEKLIRRLRNDADAYRNGETLGRAFADQEDVLDNAATALSTLQAENEKLRAELNICKEKNAGLALALLIECAPNPDCLGDDEWRAIRAELEQVKAERDAALNDLNTLRLQSGWQCFACDNDDATEGDSRCNGCNYIDGHNYKWRGP